MKARRKFIKQAAAVTWAFVFPEALVSHVKHNSMKETNIFDVIIIGGSYSGLSAAMALGRSLRKVLIIDSGQPCNIQTPHSHNFITQDGKTPKSISDEAKLQVMKYKTIQFYQGLATDGRKTDAGFELTVQNGETFEAKKLVVATGIKDIMPEIKGFSQCWGISAVHCPYCHGYEIRDQKTAIMANGERAFHLASLVNNLTNDLTIVTAGKADFNKEQLQKLDKHNIKVIESGVLEMQHEKGYVKQLVFMNGSTSDFNAVYAALPFKQHSDILTSLGCEFTDTGHVKVDPFQKTSINGVYACGDNASMMRSLANAVYSGNLAGVMANKELTDEQF